MASGSAKVALFDAFASVAQALGSGRRAEIVDVLAQGERSVEEIANEISQSVANTSQHLQVLARAGLVRSRRDGTRSSTGSRASGLGDLWAAVRDVAVRHVAEVNRAGRRVPGRAGRRRAGFRRGARAAARARRRRRARRAPGGRVPRGAHRGRRSAPLSALASLAPKLPRRREIVAYCRGPYCVYADDAVRLLRERGLKARRLDVGFPEWRRAGLPVEIAS